MGINLIEKDGACRLVFEGRLTFDRARELENDIIDVLRRYTAFEIDLSQVSEIDLCGLHLLRVLDTVGGNNVQTVATSPVVEQARKRLLSSQRGSWLRGTRSEQWCGSEHALA